MINYKTIVPYFPIYFNDLNKDAQTKFLNAVGVSDPEEMNWDMNVIPLAYYPLPYPEDLVDDDFNSKEENNGCQQRCS